MDFCFFQNANLIELDESSSILSIDTSENIDGEASVSRKRPISKSSTQKTVKKSRIDEDILMERALDLMNQRTDELDILGQLVASELRQIHDTIERNFVKKSILDVLMSRVSSQTTAQGYSSDTEYVIVTDD